MLETIGKQFKQPSGFLGRIISMMMKIRNTSAYDKIISKLEIKKSDSLFEIGYGHGIGIDRILSNYDCTISGIDFSELMHNEATKRNKKYIDAKKVELNFGDFLDFEMEIGEYDKIYCTNVVYFWDNLEKPFTKINKGLKDNGLFCFYMAHCTELEKLKFAKNEIFNKYSIEQVIEKLKLSGFEKIDFEYDKGYYVKCR